MDASRKGNALQGPTFARELDPGPLDWRCLAVARRGSEKCQWPIVAHSGPVGRFQTGCGCKELEALMPAAAASHAGLLTGAV